MSDTQPFPSTLFCSFLSPAALLAHSHSLGVTSFMVVGKNGYSSAFFCNCVLAHAWAGELERMARLVSGMGVGKEGWEGEKTWGLNGLLQRGHGTAFTNKRAV